MYVPKLNIEIDPRRILKLITENPFATEVTVKEGEPFISHLPLLVAPGVEEKEIASGSFKPAEPN